MSSKQETKQHANSRNTNQKMNNSQDEKDQKDTDE